MSESDKGDVELVHSQSEKEEEEAGSESASEKNSKSEPEEDWTLENLVTAACEEFGRQQDVQSILQLLQREWITTPQDFLDCDTGGKSIPGLPARLHVWLTKRIKEHHLPDSELGPTLEELATEEWENDEESRAQNALIRELVQHAKETDREEGPPQHLAKLYINSLTNLSTAESTISFDLGLALWWVSKEHIGAPSGVPERPHYVPDIEFAGSTELEPLFDVKKILCLWLCVGVCVCVCVNE